jgi:hypothetical protein
LVLVWFWFWFGLVWFSLVWLGLVWFGFFFLVQFPLLIRLEYLYAPKGDVPVQIYYRRYDDAWSNPFDAYESNVYFPADLIEGIIIL